MANPAKALAHNSLYETDFLEWTRQQARLLRERRWADLDLDNLVDEVESVGRSERREIQSRLVILLAHLLKWSYQPQWRSPGWTSTLFEQRHGIAQILRDSPSLHLYPASVFADQYRAARLLAAKDTGIAYVLFPDTCPFTLEEALDHDHLPDEPGAASPRDAP